MVASTVEVEFGVGVGVGVVVGVGVGVAVGAGAVTVIVLLVPELLPSEALMVTEPAEDKVTEPVQTPEVKEPEVLLVIDPVLADRLTVPAKFVTTLPHASLAVIVMGKATPAVADVGAFTVK